MTPETKDRIAALRDEKGAPCPTDRLLCIATGVKTEKETLPWSKQIQEQAGTPDDFFVSINNAVVFGRYPELEEASEYFRKEAGKQFNQQKADGGRRDQLTEDNISRLAQDTIKRFHLEDKYSFATEPTDEQQKRIDEGIKKARQEELQGCYDSHLPETSIIHHALRSSIELDAKSSVQLMRDMENLNAILANGPEKLAKVQYTAGYEDYAELHNIANKVFAMQKRGVDFSDTDAVRNSPEMQDISYQGKEYNLSGKIISADKIYELAQGRSL